MSDLGTLDLHPGSVVAGRYEIVSLLGEGGMGAVYRARQLNLGRDVALKVLLPSEVDSPENMRVRFNREARVASAIKHPNVVEIYDVGLDGELAYLAMEVLEGITLRERIPADESVLDLDLILDIASPLAEALVAAHALGAVHRDLKPENIFLEQVGAGFRVVVLDFGLAFIEEDEHAGRLTRHGIVMGTPDYLSPEQARGIEVGPPSDVYSLGCVLYELLTGRPPFTGAQLNVLTQHVYVAPEQPSAQRKDVPRELEELVMAMLRKRPESRPRIWEIRDALAVLGATLSGRRGRPRDAAFLQNRAERMLSCSPTALLSPASAPISPLGTDSDLRVAIVGTLVEEVELGLLSNDMTPVPWTVDNLHDASLVLIVDTDQTKIPDYVAAGLPVVAVVDSSDRVAIGELARLGISELTTLPIAIDNLVRALRRAKRRDDRRKHKLSQS